MRRLRHVLVPLKAEVIHTGESVKLLFAALVVQNENRRNVQQQLVTERLERTLVILISSLTSRDEASESRGKAVSFDKAYPSG